MKGNVPVAQAVIAQEQVLSRRLDDVRLAVLIVDGIDLKGRTNAAASLGEGMEETLTLTRLGIRGSLKQTLESTNPLRVDDRVRPPQRA